METKEPLNNQCGFCGRDSTEVADLIVSTDSAICSDCVEVCSSQLVDKPQQEGGLRSMDLNLTLTPQSILDELNDTIISQDKVKRDLAVAAYNHIKRINNLSSNISKSNVLMIGPSGSGKTLICETLAGILDLPFVVADATTYTEAGYYGEDVDSMLSNLLEKASGDVEAAQRGIIFIDEIDKIASSNGKNANNKGVQQALLKLIEGSNLMISRDNGQQSKNKDIAFNTKNILFICGGSFDGLDRVVSKRTSNKSIGITANVTTRTNYKELMNDLSTQDLERYGMIKEFLGRLPVVSALNPINEPIMRRILTEPKNSIIKQYQALFALDNIVLSFDEDALDEIAKMAIKNKTGARGLKTIIESLLAKLMFSAPELNVDEVIITKDFVLGENTYLTKNKLSKSA